MRFVNYFFERFLALNSNSNYALIPLAIEAFVTSSVPSVTKRLKESFIFPKINVCFRKTSYTDFILTSKNGISQLFLLQNPVSSLPFQKTQVFILSVSS